ncbi:hypothetical protein LI925_03855, partial [Cutibacterium acnes]|nr:hypothetical protein [Cutibacterium acnes]
MRPHTNMVESKGSASSQLPGVPVRLYRAVLTHTLQFPRDNEDARGQASDLLTEILSEGRGQRM